MGSGGAAAIQADKFPFVRAAPYSVFQHPLQTHKNDAAPHCVVESHTARNNPASPPLAHPKPLTAAAQAAEDKCGDFAEGCFRCKRKFKQPSATGAAPLCSRDTHRNGARGGPGESHAHLAFPRRLSAAFDARKRPPRNNTHPAATEGSTNHSTSNSAQQKKQQATK